MLVIDIVHKFIEKAIKIKRELVNVYKTILKKALEERGRERSSVWCDKIVLGKLIERDGHMIDGEKAGQYNHKGKE